MKLKISDTLQLPIEFVTSTQAILAVKGAGKTYTASVQAEELLELGQQTVIIDPTGAWYGLKSSADGQRPGFSIPIFGGEHADVPLPVFRRGKDEEASQFAAGETLAAAIVENYPANGDARASDELFGG